MPRLGVKVSRYNTPSPLLPDETYSIACLVLVFQTCSKCRVLGFHSERCFQKHNVLCRPIRRVLGERKRDGGRPGLLSDNVFHGTTRSPSNSKGASASQSSNCSTDAADASRASIGKRRRVCFSFTLTCVSSGGEESDAQERSVKCRFEKIFVSK